MYMVPNVEEIKRRRIEADLSMLALSKAAGLPDNAILRIEKGASQKINHLRMREIANALHCKVEDITFNAKGVKI